nr:ATP-binding cassette domain-containing protein [uncultured Neokomagataea sp.]
MQATSKTMPVLSLRDVTLAHGAHVLVRSCSCDVPLSGMTLLSGRNGAGKSTFLQALLGMVRPVHGDLLLDGIPVEQVKARFGYMPQGRSEMPGRTEGALAIPALAHIRAALYGQRWGMWPSFQKERDALEALLARVGIPNGRQSYVHRPLGQLSGGERQRVALAQALAPLRYVERAVLLLDEPLAALDAPGRDALLALLADLTASGTAVVLTSHDMAGLVGMTSRNVTLMEETLHVCV